MANNSGKFHHDSIAAWAKRCYLAGRAVMDAALRPYDIGATQWYVLYQLAHEGSTMQRDLMRLLQIERATLSIVVGALVRKGWVEQVPDCIDRRQKRLRMTAAGKKLWAELPDLTFIRTAAFEGIDQAEIATAIKVLQTATGRLDELLRKGTDA
ncbi:MarR family transcriptional regulator [Pseudomonas daroniae]|uniref:MarR family transcriptional regulator n=1 Tax=Phytopseudomonas daroniae TaxID=2487519 RepID=A0A4Q9QFL5_9GAMM|nr:MULTISPECIES: MarR family transcriptional regulator [Pseudomonas]TBU71824.1 MarR family transcriptional regulator [Pseudomonas daroniae]TBU78151.1 MarR family transcriptional regulator [Pseudomonas sp. FRB 228]TBU87967.1 MarR family transcriptional regulator [Pseudomonas daroniae]